VIQDPCPCFCCQQPVRTSGVWCAYTTAAGEQGEGLAHAGCVGVPLLVDVEDIANEVLDADA
jgi:hypothetical protein